MQRLKILWVALMLLAGAAMAPGSVPAAATALSRSAAKMEILAGAMHHIDDMRLKISEKLSRARQIHAFVLSRRKDIAGEIQRRRATLNIRAFGQAMKDRRIRYNLQLAGKLQAYGEYLSGRIDFFQTGDDQFGFFYAAVGDDLKMIRAVSGLSVERLVRDVTQTLDTYRPAVKAPLVDMKQIPAISSEKIWNALVARPSDPSSMAN